MSFFVLRNIPLGVLNDHVIDDVSFWPRFEDWSQTLLAFWWRA